jgi:hypothetical protein
MSSSNVLPEILDIILYFMSLPRALDVGGESLYLAARDVLKASDCGRLGRQAADHPWSALRMVKAAGKTTQRPRCCSKPKQQLRIQNGTRAHYLNCLHRREGEAGKRSAGNRIDRKVIDRQTDRQVETGR